MATYLVIAHQTARSYELSRAMREQVEQDPEAEFVLLVPATPPELLSAPSTGSLRDIAREVAAEAADSFRNAGFKVKWTIIGDQSPIVAMDTEVRDHPREYAGIIISTFPRGRSRWLDLQILRSAEAFSLPLVHVVDHTGLPNALTKPVTED